jgi:hypothetical protein
MSIPANMRLYEEVKAYADTVYKKPSAYKSGFIVKTYKQRGGTYIGGERPLGRWFDEKWTDVGGKGYPVYRPTRRISVKTPLLASEIKPSNLREQIERKQKIKGNANLSPFVGK